MGEITAKRHWAVLLFSVTAIYGLVFKFYDLRFCFRLPYFGQPNLIQFGVLNGLIVALSLFAILSYIKILRSSASLPLINEISYPQITEYFPPFIVAITITIFLSFFWNKFVPVQEGWFNVYSALMAEGKTPYKDFYFFLQPGYLYIIYTVTSLFGNSILVLREYGFLERVILAVLIYSLFSRTGSKSAAMLASIVAVTLFSGYNVDGIHSYEQTCDIFIVAACLFALKYVDKLEAQQSGLGWLFLAGLAGGAAFSVKQTLGLFIPFAILSCVAIYIFKFNAKKLWQISIFFLGYITPELFFSFKLYQAGAFQFYINQVFQTSVATKGGWAEIFLGAISRAMFGIVFWMPIALVIGLTVFSQRAQLSNFNKRKMSHWLPLLSLCSFYIAAYFLQNSLSPQTAVRFFEMKENNVFLAYDVSIVLSVTFFILFTVRERSARLFQWLVISVAAMSLMYVHGLSSVSDCQSGILAIGLFILITLTLKTPFMKVKNSLVYTVCAFMVLGTLMQRCAWPFAWWGWLEPATKMSVATSSLPALDGLLMSKSTLNMYEDITRIVNQNTQPGDSIYEFPHMAIFYLLANKIPHHFSPVDFFDVSSDQSAERTVSELVASPPKVMIIENMPESVWRFHEVRFRQGRPIGQRKIIDTVNLLVKQYHYKTVYTVNNDAYTINVLIRAARVSKRSF